MAILRRLSYVALILALLPTCWCGADGAPRAPKTVAAEKNSGQRPKKSVTDDEGGDKKKRATILDSVDTKDEEK